MSSCLAAPGLAILAGPRRATPARPPPALLVFLDLERAESETRAHLAMGPPLTDANLLARAVQEIDDIARRELVSIPAKPQQSGPLPPHGPHAQINDACRVPDWHSRLLRPSFDVDKRCPVHHIKRIGFHEDGELRQ